jgi:ribosome-binding protein aMBF1 (putative translation factor)
MMDPTPSNGKRRNDERTNDALEGLTSIPGNIWETFMQSVQESRDAISEAVKEAMEQKGISVYHLHEETGLSCDFIESVLDATMPLNDSEPISLLERALQIRLNHL